MKVGFYIDSLAGDEKNLRIFNQLNLAVQNRSVEDACLFYNKIEFNPIVPKFGVFNATDIWNFTGLLIATTVQNVITARNIVNKFKLCFLFDGDRDFVNLLKLSREVPILVKNDEDEKFIRRVTGQTPIRISDELDVASIIQAV